MTNYTTTENGAGALKSTMNACLDAFGSLGAMRFSDEETIINTFEKAFYENRALAMKMAFYMRDIRAGQGCRKQFRVIMKWLANHHPNFVNNNLVNVLEFGRGDDYLCLFDTPCGANAMAFMRQQLIDDLRAMKQNKPISLLAKWMPSCNTSSAETREYAKQFMKFAKLPERHYRKILSSMRQYLNVVEHRMSAREWKEIDYEKVPAKAMLKYEKAFTRHDENGYDDYLLKIATGAAKVNAASLIPVDIVHKCFTDRKKTPVLYDAMWANLPNYFKNRTETGICVVDVSGSMVGTPMEVAISLGMYCADKCHGPFKDKFITFSGTPELVHIAGNNIQEKVTNVSRANWDGNTNLEAVFDLMLTAAKSAHLDAKYMPEKLYIISDMQFDQARNIGSYWTRTMPEPFMAKMRRKYAAAGYSLPTIVYWNVNASKCGMFQQTFEGENCCMVSGYSPALFKAVIDGTQYVEEVNEKGEHTLKAEVDPIKVMLTALNDARYDVIWVG